MSSAQRIAVWNGERASTTGGLKKSDLMKNRHGRIVSKRKSEVARKLNNLGNFLASKAKAAGQEPKPKPKPKPKPEPAKKPAPKPKPEPKPDPKPVIPEIEEPSLEEMLAEEELEMAKPAEPAQQETQDAASNADQSDVEVASFTDAISAQVGQRWRIPGNYRNRDDIKTQVRIQMIPGGEVINVSVVKSSGYPDFDESVMNAVKLASPLPVPDGPLFDKQFRSLVIEFDPGVAQ